MKKRILAILLFGAMAINLTACSSGIFGLLGQAVDIVENTDVVEKEKFVFDMPYGFEYSEEDEMYMSSDRYAGWFYEKEMGSIGLTGSESDKKLTEDFMKMAMGFTGDDDVEITITEWEETEVDGHDALYFMAEIDYSGTEITFMQYMIQGTANTHTIYFMEIGELYYWDQFEECVDSFRFE